MPLASSVKGRAVRWLSGLAAKDRRTFRERLREHIETIWHFCDNLKYQLQFEGHRMLETVEREGAAAGSGLFEPGTPHELVERVVTNNMGEGNHEGDVLSNETSR